MLTGKLLEWSLMEFVPILFANGPKSRSYPFVISAPWLVQVRARRSTDTLLPLI